MFIVGKPLPLDFSIWATRLGYPLDPAGQLVEDADIYHLAVKASVQSLRSADFMLVDCVKKELRQQ